jgi:hypothetical protein
MHIMRQIARMGCKLIRILRALSKRIFRNNLQATQIINNLFEILIR